MAARYQVRDMTSEQALVLGELYRRAMAGDCERSGRAGTAASRAWQLIMA